MTPDPIGLEGGINLFAYGAGNPANRIDPLGLWFDDMYQNVITDWVNVPSSEGSSNPDYGVIRAPGPFYERAVESVYTDIYNFISPSLPNQRVDVFMDYLGYATAFVGSGEATGIKCLGTGTTGKLLGSRWFRKNIFASFTSEAGQGYSLFRDSIKFMTHHTKHHGHHMQLEIIGLREPLRIPRPASWNPRTWWR